MFGQSSSLGCCCLLAVAVLVSAAVRADSPDESSRLQRLRDLVATQRENRAALVSEDAAGVVAVNLHEESFQGRRVLLYVPSGLPPFGQRSLLVALHGGGGNAEFMRQHLNMDGLAERYGFIVAYPEGSAAAAIASGRMKAWNAGLGCCGKPFADAVDDVGYLQAVVRHVQQQWGVDPARIVGTGHSNGAMMTQTLMCQTRLYSRAVTLAGTLMTDRCPEAAGLEIINYHGAADVNVPIAGGRGQKGVTDIDFRSQQQSARLFEQAGGHYRLVLLEGADHRLEHMSEASQRQFGMTIAERLVQDLGLQRP